jgi:hypothetical protein
MAVIVPVIVPILRMLASSGHAPAGALIPSPQQSPSLGAAARTGSGTVERAYQRAPPSSLVYSTAEPPLHHSGAQPRFGDVKLSVLSQPAGSDSGVDAPPVGGAVRETIVQLAPPSSVR